MGVEININIIILIILHVYTYKIANHSMVKNTCILLLDEDEIHFKKLYQITLARAQPTELTKITLH